MGGPERRVERGKGEDGGGKDATRTKDIDQHNAQPACFRHAHLVPYRAGRPRGATAFCAGWSGKERAAGCPRDFAGPLARGRYRGRARGPSGTGYPRRSAWAGVMGRSSGSGLGELRTFPRGSADGIGPIVAVVAGFGPAVKLASTSLTAARPRWIFTTLPFSVRREPRPEADTDDRRRLARRPSVCQIKRPHRNRRGLGAMQLIY